MLHKASTLCVFRPCTCVCWYVVCTCAPQDLYTPFPARISEWHFFVPQIILSPPYFTEHRQAEALKEVLEQLALLSAPGAVIQLSSWRWDEACVQAVADMLPKLGHLSFSIKTREYEPVTDEQLSLMLRVAEHVPRLSVGSLSLQSDTHANTPWPWDELTIDTLDIADLCKLPDPSGAKDGVWVECVTVMVDRKTIEQVRHTHLHTHTHTRTRTNTQSCVSDSQVFAFVYNYHVLTRTSPCIC